MGKPGYTGLRRIANAAKYSAQGFGHAWRYESAFRQEITVTLLLVPVALWLGRTPIERMMLIACCFFVVVVELLNSAVETAIDRVGDEQHELSGRAKDLGSAAVFVSVVIPVAVWGTVAWQRFMPA